MKDEIKRVVELQEELGFDVLVHGEPERNDMVQYFAENLEGFDVTVHGWVQSYGSRCTRPSILWGDVTRSAPITVEWAEYAQSLTNKPMKGMLTGPVTILAWSFVRDDQPLGETANQVALALRDEIADLEAAGIKVIQVDEPALRELLPLRKADQAAYLDWSVKSFRLATAGAADATQVHTHLCYSEFGAIIDAIDGLDADVTSIEAARSRMEVVHDLESPRLRPRRRPGRLRHPLAARPGRAGSHRTAQHRRQARPVPPALGQPGLRPEDPRLRRDRRVPAQPGHGHQDGPRRTARSRQVASGQTRSPTTAAGHPPRWPAAVVRS